MERLACLSYDFSYTFCMFICFCIIHIDLPLQFLSFYFCIILSFKIFREKMLSMKIKELSCLSKTQKLPHPHRFQMNFREIFNKILEKKRSKMQRALQHHKNIFWIFHPNSTLTLTQRKNFASFIQYSFTHSNLFREHKVYFYDVTNLTLKTSQWKVFLAEENLFEFFLEWKSGWEGKSQWRFDGEEFSGWLRKWKSLSLVNFTSLGSQKEKP